MRKTMGALLGVVMAGAFSVAAAPSASAITWDHTMKTKDDNPGGIIKFRDAGDVVEICDLQADGYNVVGVVDDGVWGHGYKIKESRGQGHCTRVDAKKNREYDLSENRYVSFMVCLEKGGDDSYFCHDGGWLNKKR
ncbi:hypothetical protein [Amycolatopsis viridis]|uniref:Secreted protein n=1 Tax=Amycolatopsis viridis TaxID=185678 RepID=A0ABX0SU60_9PSEU|nr:hypothetical protein [Amycolatopsis viridis]NIH79169.1 hypothetical protein [Amycolatopsis viridis]